MVIAPPRALCRARISSLATYVPPRVLTNADLERMVDTSDEWILQRTGIRERHIVDAGVATSDLAVEAARVAIERARLTPDDIDFIVVGTTTPDMLFPSTACLVQERLGANHAWGYDLFAACSGFTYALTTAAQMVSAGGSKHALVIGADVMSSIIDYTDRTTCVIFGDGAGAAVVEASDDEGIGIIDFENYIDGSGGAALCMPAGGSRQPASAGHGREADALREAGRSGGLQVRRAQHRRGMPADSGPQQYPARGYRPARLASGQSTNHSVGRRETRGSRSTRSSSTSSASATRRRPRFHWPSTTRSLTSG